MVQTIENNKSKMTPENFVYWLQSMLEGNADLEKKGLTPKQAKMIQEHLSLVLTKVTPTTFTTTDAPGIFPPYDAGTTVIC